MLLPFGLVVAPAPRAKETDAQQGEADAEDDPWRHHEEEAVGHRPCPMLRCKRYRCASSSPPGERACPMELTWWRYGGASRDGDGRRNGGHGSGSRGRAQAARFHPDLSGKSRFHGAVD